MKSFLRNLVLLAPFCTTMLILIAVCVLCGVVRTGALISAVSVSTVVLVLLAEGVYQGVRSVVAWFHRFRSRSVIARARVVKRR